MLTWRELQGLTLTARQLVEGLYAGRHLSPRPGPGLDFHDYRPYSLGDEPRTIDWKLYARTDRLHVRRHRHLTDLSVYLLVDASASMDFAGLDALGQPRADLPTKLRYALTAAAALATLTQRQQDRVGGALACGALMSHQAPTSSAAALTTLLASFADATPSRGSANLPQVLREGQRRLGRRCLIVVLSDFLDDLDELLAALAQLTHERFEVVALQVLTPQELTLAGLGDHAARLCDPETRQELTARPALLASAYARELAAHQHRLRRGCEALRIEQRLWRTDQDLAQMLRAWLQQRMDQTA